MASDLPSGMSRWRVVLVAVLALAGQAAAYDPETHQELTFLAAKQLARCQLDSTEPLLTPLEVRAVANSSAQLAEGGMVARVFRWHYYDPLAREGDWSTWLVNTRFTNHYARLIRDLERAKSEERVLEALGRLVGYLQLATSPARALPVFAARFWRGAVTDRFDSYPLKKSPLEGGLGDDCVALDRIPESFEQLLADVADATRLSIASPIGHLPTTWEAYWRPPESAGEFGSYGPAGNNFGRYSDFPCGPGENHRCVLITDDPAYLAFALERHRAAIRATALAFRLYRQRYGERRVGADTERAAIDAE